MDERRYERLVAELEIQVATNPRLYRLKAGLAAAFAYLLLFLLLILLVFAGLEVAAYIGDSDRSPAAMAVLVLVIVPLVVLVGRMASLELRPTYGTEITVADAPRLFRLLRHLRKRMPGPPIHRVVVTADFNIAIEQTPRLGFFGVHRNHLVIGLPMAFALSNRELAGLIAHEYWHLSPRRLGGWVYRQRRSFGRLLERAAEQKGDDWMCRLLHALLKAFALRYNALTFTLARRDEYEADTAATRLVGRSRFASGLIRRALIGRWLADSFWPKIYSQADLREKPLFMPYAAMPTAFRAGWKEWRNSHWLEEAWSKDSSPLDPHPCLRERVAAHDGDCKLPGAVRQSAADALLGPFARDLANRLDSHWWGAERIAWQRYCREKQRDWARLAELDAQGAERLNAAEMQEYGQLLLAADRCDDAKRVLESLLSSPGESSVKHTLLYGKVLLKENDANGLNHLEMVVKLAPSLADECIEAGCRWLAAQQGEAAAKDWFAAMQQRREEVWA